MQQESFGPIFESLPSEAAKAFARENPDYHFAWISVPSYTLFPVDMLRYDCCEFANSAYEQMATNHNEDVQSYRTDRGIGILVRRKKDHHLTKWTLARWSSFGVACYILSGE